MKLFAFIYSFITIARFKKKGIQKLKKIQIIFRTTNISHKRPILVIERSIYYLILYYNNKKTIFKSKKNKNNIRDDQ